MSKIQPDNYRFLQENIRRQSGIVIDDDKHYLIESRLLPLAIEHGLKNLDELCLRLRMLSDISLQRKVIEAMTTNETFFFREPGHFQALRDTVLPALIERRRSEQKLSIWSAAASTGQEAYSLAMLVCELGLESWDIRIVGTDIAASVLDRAASGIYSQLECARGLPPEYRAKYCTQRADGAWEIKPAVRRLTSFTLLDLRYSIRSLGMFDIVFCRNVLIYFDSATKLRIIEDINTALNPGGYLFLGGGEISLAVGPSFKRINTGDSTFYQTVRSAS